MGIAALLRGVATLLASLIVLSACTVVVDEPSPGPEPGYCTRDYRPVCARRYGEQRSFANACLADRAGYRIVHRGECRRDDGGDDQRFCTKEYRPVCARRDGRLRTFGNACEAEAAGWRIVGRGEC